MRHVLAALPVLAAVACTTKGELQNRVQMFCAMLEAELRTDAEAVRAGGPRGTARAADPSGWLAIHRDTLFCIGVRNVPVEEKLERGKRFGMLTSRGADSALEAQADPSKRASLADILEQTADALK